MKPVIAITGDNQVFEGYVPSCVVFNKYIDAAVHGAQGVPWVIPPIGNDLDFDVLLDRIDGILLTGSVSNIEPHHYGGPPLGDSKQDPKRDEVTLQLIPQLVERGIPVLGICRGFQELNVAFGGSLHDKVYQLPDMIDHHREFDAPNENEASIADKFSLAHSVSIQPGGLLEKISGMESAMVNSLHGQGLNELAPRLQIEALAPDGLIEAVSVIDAKAFALGVQWHPEWDFAGYGFYNAVFKAFGIACRDYASRR